MFSIYYKDGRPGIAFNGKTALRPAETNIPLREVKICVETLNKFSFIQEPIFSDCNTQEEVDDVVNYIMPDPGRRTVARSADSEGLRASR